MRPARDDHLESRSNFCACQQMPPYCAAIWTTDTKMKVMLLAVRPAMNVAVNSPAWRNGARQRNDLKFYTQVNRRNSVGRK